MCTLKYAKKSLFFAHRQLPAAGLFSSSRLLDSPRVHYVASLGPGRAPWCVLWALKVTSSWLLSRDRFPSTSQAGQRKPTQYK